jgi:hypothetical protein
MHATVLDLSKNNLRGRLDDPVLVDAFVKLAPLWNSFGWTRMLLLEIFPSVFADSSFPQLDALDVMNNQLSGSLHPAFAKRKQNCPVWTLPATS